MNAQAPAAASADWFVALGPFLDPLALAIVLGGTLLAVVLRSPARDLVRAVSALRALGRRGFDAEPLLQQIAALARIASRHGVMALDRSVIADRDVAAGVAAAVDGCDRAQILALAVHRRACRDERQAAAIQVWEAAAEAAPAMGMIGTLIGLVKMFMAMQDPNAIGGAMAIALLTTLYGAIVASLVALPVASRLRRLAVQEARERARLDLPLAALADIGRTILRERAA
jgi:chemotaxis protein MotA